jgi:tRNA1(Val) A37 N6-methylase TrmN6
MNIELLSDERLDRVNENLTIIQKKQGLTFGSDTFLLSAFVKEQKYARAADLGSGTGIAALLCGARGKFARIYAIEIQKSFCELIEKNIEYNNLSGVIKPINADVREISPAHTDGELDVVFSNPPYMKTNSGKRNDSDEKYIARHEVFGGIFDFCAAASRLLKFGGKFYCVYRPDRLTELISAMQRTNLEPKRMTFVHPDTETAPSSVLIEAKKGASPSLVLTKPLIIHRTLNVDGSAREMTDSAKEIYDTCSFENFNK